MNLKKILILLPLSIFNFILSAQVEDLMRDKNITWIAETYNDFQLEEAHEKLIGKKLNAVTPLKFMDIEEGNSSEEFVFQEFLMKALLKEQVTVFKNDNCTDITTYGKRVDSITVINPITFETSLSTPITNILIPQFYPFFRAHQIVFYNAKKAKFGLRTLAIAPMMRNFQYYEDSILYVPAFWIKAQDLSKKPKLKNKNIAWARRLNLSKGFLLTETKPKKGEICTKILKKVGDNMPIEHYLETVKTNPKISFYPTFQSKNVAKYSMKDRNLMLSNVDTIQHINPYTYERTLKIIKTEKTGQDFQHLRLVQNWYWNSRKNRLEIYLVAAAPVEDMYEEDMQFKDKYKWNPVPILYRRTDD